MPLAHLFRIHVFSRQIVMVHLGVVGCLHQLWAKAIRRAKNSLWTPVRSNQTGDEPDSRFCSLAYINQGYWISQDYLNLVEQRCRFRISKEVIKISWSLQHQMTIRRKKDNGNWRVKTVEEMEAVSASGNGQELFKLKCRHQFSVSLR